MVHIWQPHFSNSWITGFFYLTQAWLVRRLFSTAGHFPQVRTHLPSLISCLLALSSPDTRQPLLSWAGLWIFFIFLCLILRNCVIHLLAHIGNWGAFWEPLTTPFKQNLDSVFIGPDSWGTEKQFFIFFFIASKPVICLIRNLYGSGRFPSWPFSLLSYL